MRFTFHSVNHKDKKTTSGKDKSQDKFKTFYNANNGIKLITCKASSSNSSNIFVAHRCHVDLVFRILTNTFLKL